MSSSEAREQCQPSEADWYAEVVYGRGIPGGTETDYNYGYWAGDRPGAAEIRSLIPDGYRKLESHVKPTKH